MKIAKVFAILSVIFAHSRNADYYFVGNITERIGAVGVPVFLFISGYYFNINNSVEIKKFWHKKFLTILVPWVFTGSILYFYNQFKTNFINFSILNLANWLLGNGTYLWYLSVLMLCYCFMCLVRRELFLKIFIIINILSLILTSFGLIDYLAEILGIKVNNYLNVFNWIGYFSIGVIAKGRLEDFFSFLKTKVFYIIPSYIILLFIVFLIEPNAGGYFSKLAIPMQLAGMIFIFTLSTMEIFNKPVFHNLSDLTFSIYLTHFMVFPIRRFFIESPIFEFLNPIIILIFNAGLLLLIRKVSKIFYMDKLYNTLLGIRDYNKKI
jgi:surface polysaccharide O-acyltransferase-like enzyme